MKRVIILLCPMFRVLRAYSKRIVVPKGSTVHYDPNEDLSFLPQGALDALKGTAFVPPSSSDGFDPKGPSSPMPNVDYNKTPVMLEWLEDYENRNNPDYIKKKKE